MKTAGVNRLLPGLSNQDLRSGLVHFDPARYKICMTPERRKQIGEIADAVRTQLALEGPPFDVRTAVSLLGGEIVRPEDPLTEASVRVTGPNAFTIESSESATTERERFSIAHELGHLVLHLCYLNANPVDDEYKDSPMFRAGHTEEEFEAHEFAGAFLMPAAEFADVARKYLGQDGYDVSKIAAHFNVSVKAATTRGRWLRLFAW
jgi:predicted transcriptional regulator